jgi:polysaccharide pyruvyl transferase CsaB
MAEDPIRIAVSGYYGCGNTGDEAVLAGIVESFARRAGQGAARFTVLSQDPRDTEQRHGLAAVDRMSLAAVRETLRSSDLLLSGGGSLLQDTTSVRSLVYYLWIARLGLRARVPVMFYAQGIGPLRRPVSRILTRVVANRVARITVRDPGSAELLRRIGVTRPPVEVTADPAFALTPALEERVRDIRSRAGITGIESGSPVVGVAIRPWRADGGTKPGMLAQLCDIVAESTGAQIAFIPMQPPGDIDTSTSVAAAMRRGDAARVVREHLLPREALGLVGSMNALIAMRLHALIFAAAAGGVPMVALSYDPKVTQLMEGLGQSPYNMELSSLEPERAAEAVIHVIRSDSAAVAQLRERAAAMAERALVTVDRALAVVHRADA